MLQLIVLGLVPGTNIQITLNWVLIVALVLFVLFDARLIWRHRDRLLHRRKAAGSNKELSLASL